jgi:hypothetical protein
LASATASFPVSWSGSDDAGGPTGAGIRTYDVFVSIDGGPFAPWLTETPATSATYDGQPGSQYAFYSVATDQLGHSQATPVEAQAATYVTHRPSFSSIPVTQATQDVFYTYAVSSIDQETGETRTISATALPAWLSLVDHSDGTATLSGTPANSQVGSHSITLFVTDSAGASQSQAFIIGVVNVNDPPAQITLSRSSIFADLPGAWIALVTVGDPDVHDAHTFEVDDPRFTVTAGHLYLKAGQFLDRATEPAVTLRITATDAGTPALSFSAAFALAVEARPPVWDHAYQWAPHVFDVNADGHVTPLDALLIINELNANGPQGFAPRDGGTAPPNFFDTSGDDEITPLDALLIVNYLNAGGNGEAEPDSGSFAAEVWSDDESPWVSPLADDSEEWHWLSGYLRDADDQRKSKREAMRA